MKRGFRQKMKRGFRQNKSEFEVSKPWQAPVAIPRAHDPVMTRHVRLPLVQAVICGYFAALLPAGIAAIIIISAKVGGWWWAAVPVTFAMSGLALSGIAWYILFVMNTKTLLLIERFIGVDLNRDGVVGKPVPEPKPTTTFVDFTNRDERHNYKVELPVTDGTMGEIAHAMLESEGRFNFSRRDTMANTSISDDAFEKLQKQFLLRGWAAYRKEDKPNSGVVLLAAGRAVLRGYL